MFYVKYVVNECAYKDGPYTYAEAHRRLKDIEERDEVSSARVVREQSPTI